MAESTSGPIWTSASDAALLLTPDLARVRSVGITQHGDASVPLLLATAPGSEALADADAGPATAETLVDESHASESWSLLSPVDHGVDIASWTDADG